jgi:hypothetical protein
MSKKKRLLFFFSIFLITFVGYIVISFDQVFPILQATTVEIDSVEPNFGPPRIIVSIYPRTGNFGEKMTNDRVQMSEYDIAENQWIYVDVPIYKWSPDKIQFRVPDMTFQAGVHYVRVKKTDTYGNTIYTTPWKEFDIRERPNIISITPSTGSWGAIVAVKGSGFGDVKEYIHKGDEILGDGIGNDDGTCESFEVCYPDYGFSTYIEFNASNDKYRATEYPKNVNGLDWESNDISFKLANLLDTNTGNPVPAQELYKGCWNVNVVTDYFRDDGDGKYNYGLNGLDMPSGPLGTGSGDELLYRGVSNPVCFISSGYVPPPYISSVILYKQAQGLYVIQVTGTGFSTTQGAGYVIFGARIITGTNIISWSNTSIKFKFTYVSGTYPRVVTRTLKVVRNDGAISNSKEVTIVL